MPYLGVVNHATMTVDLIPPYLMELSGFWCVSDSGSATFTGIGNQRAFLLLPVLLWSLYLPALIVPTNAVFSLGLLCLSSLVGSESVYFICIAPCGSAVGPLYPEFCLSVEYA